MYQPDLFLVAGLALAAVALIGFIIQRGRTADRKTAATDSVTGNAASTPAGRLSELAEALDPVFERVAHPAELIDDVSFVEAVNLLATDTFSLEKVGNYAMGANWVLRAVGLQALAQRDTKAQLLNKVIRSVRTQGAFPMFFLLRYADARATEPFVTRVIAAAEYWWRENPVVIDAVGRSVDAQLATDSSLVFGNEYLQIDADGRSNVSAFVAQLPEVQRRPVQAALEQARASLVDTDFLKSVGRFLSPTHFREPVYDTEQIMQLRDEFEQELSAEHPRSVVLVGPSGVGKSALRRRFGRALLDADWRVCQTSAKQLVADKKFVGEIEGQIQRLVRNATVEKRVALFIDSLTELNEYGRSSGNKNSVLDQLWPEIEAQRILMVSETTASGLQTLLRRYPALPTKMKVMTLAPVLESEAETLMSQHLDDVTNDLPEPARREIVDESLKLAQQYLSHKSLPGSALSLLDLTVQLAERDGAPSPERQHVLSALSQVSGLPEDLLDDQQNLDIRALRSAFRKRVIGQDEAVDCLLERVAMLKAGLSDPGRPVGVFLFAGPTGTGKTEIAKTLADVLFGSEDQMIRLDMSEYQEPDSAWRLLGHGPEHVASASLVARIREQPFSIVLLDEFEKAHRKVWDLFLQVFDDGRLTDTRGATADFRHAIIILTSNLGATIRSEAGPGFTSKSGSFSPTEVQRSVARTFRREFINRLDRVVVFNPLSRDVMRAILRKELLNVLSRRGLRSKQWAVEWEDSAVEFLLTEGFTPDLGARPLRRAIERHLLAPLSLTMVQNRAPQGEQFLFIRSRGDGLEVEFIDPDAAPEPDHTATDQATPPDGISLQKIMLASGSLAGDAAYVLQTFDEIAKRTSDPEWSDDKNALMEQMSEDGFWERADRSVVLDRIELIDRIDSAMSSLARLAERLRSRTDNRTLIQSMAGRLFVLREGMLDYDAQRPTAALLGIRLVTEDQSIDGAPTFLRNINDMYWAWGRARGMRISRLTSTPGRYPLVYEVSGFGSYGLLEPEAGVHVFESHIEGGRHQRLRARVNVIETDQDIDNTSLRETRVVRRYRREPSPLVRDGVSGWRTGRLDVVFGGAFDLFEAD